MWCVAGGNVLRQGSSSSMQTCIFVYACTLQSIYTAQRVNYPETPHCVSHGTSWLYKLAWHQCTSVYVCVLWYVHKRGIIARGGIILFNRNNLENTSNSSSQQTQMPVWLSDRLIKHFMPLWFMESLLTLLHILIYFPHLSGSYASCRYCIIAFISRKPKVWKNTGKANA